MKPSRALFLFLSLIFLFASCNPTKILSEGQYMLTRNNVTVEDAHNPDFDNLKSYLRPQTNTKPLDFIRTGVYVWGQPKYNAKLDTLKDTKFKKMLRERMGKEPVLLDSVAIDQSINQLSIVMRQLGYLNASIRYEVVPKKSDPKKVETNYYITANKPFTISNINYNIDIPEYKKIVVIHKNESLLKPGMQYNENLINQEITRITNDIRSEGYYYVEKSIIRCEVIIDSPKDTTSVNNTISLEINMRMPDNANVAKYLYKYYYNDAYIWTNYDVYAEQGRTFDTLRYTSRLKKDSTVYHFITPHIDAEEPLKDFHYRTIADAIYSKKGMLFTQNAKRMSTNSFNRLDNFNYVKIDDYEDPTGFDTINKTGKLNTYYRLTRKKLHGIGAQIDLRNDKSALSVSYTNRNFFKGAEHFTLNASAGYFYYSFSNLFSKEKNYVYPEFEISASLDFPKLFLFRRAQRADAVRYSTSFNLGVNYSGLYKRFMYNASLTYNWAPNNNLLHSLSPIDLSTINNNNKRLGSIIHYEDYTDSYQKKFGKFMLMAFKYNLKYMVPFKPEKRNNDMRLSFTLESDGLLLKGLNALFSPDKRWVLARNSLDTSGYEYTTFEKFDLTWNYIHHINKKNAVAMHLDVGALIPLDKESHIPFEKGFFMGTGNSMRGWGYRGLGPGSYVHGKDSLFTGDVKLECNLEYRGTIYGAIKYGIFADVGNIWLARKQDDMPNAEFAFNRFFKELALDVGLGLRIDLNFIVLRLDYALPLFNPNISPEQGRWINKQWWSNGNHFRWVRGLKFAFGYAF